MDSAFTTKYLEIEKLVDSIDPIQYGKTRNYKEGAVTRLSPYISRGVISTKQVLNAILERGYQPDAIQKFIQELAWRDYWQNVWVETRDALNSDLKRKQEPVNHFEMCSAVLNAKTDINAVDDAILELYDTGYMHNHMRMYVASICTNMAFAHWKIPAKWMYYHLLDADWASNALSWQWVAGSNANKKYVVNQKNINKYWSSKQEGTFLDVSYEGFASWKVPDVLKESDYIYLKTELPKKSEISIDRTKVTLVYNFYNIDPIWRKGEDVNRILLLEPSFFMEYPISQKSLDFVLELSKNIEGIQIFIGEFSELKKYCSGILFKEHPTNSHYEGMEEDRDWMFSTKGYYSSFFKFWKECNKEL